MYVFLFNDTATTEIYTLSLLDALPICRRPRRHPRPGGRRGARTGARARTRVRAGGGGARAARGDRKSTRLNSSHANISYAVFCLKKKHRHLTTDDLPLDSPLCFGSTSK